MLRENRLLALKYLDKYCFLVKKIGQKYRYTSIYYGSYLFDSEGQHLTCKTMADEMAIDNELLKIIETGASCDNDEISNLVAIGVLETIEDNNRRFFVG